MNSGVLSPARGNVMGNTKVAAFADAENDARNEKEKKTYTVSPVTGLRYSITKSNRLIQAKYKCSVLEEKIVYAALYAAQNKSFVETDDGYEVIISPNELREMTGYKGGSFYSKLQPAAQALAQRVYGVEDPEHDRFEYTNLISKCVYDKGEFKITFNRTQRNLIMNLTTNFTQLPVLMMKLKNVYAFRLYELLRSECYYKKNTPKAERTNLFLVSHSVSELKLALGVIDANEREVRRILSSKNPDYDKAVEKAKDSMYNVNGNFTRDVIAKAVKEINEKLDMHVDYKTRRKGSQLHDIEFVVMMKEEKKEEPDKVLDEAELFEFHSKVLKLFDNKLGFSEVPRISRESDYDMSKLMEIREMMDNSKTVISNPAGFILKALEEGYQSNSKTNDNVQDAVVIESGVFSEAKKILGEKFKDEDVMNVLVAADNDIEKVKKAKGILDGKKRVSSAVGFIISAIKKDYKEVESYGKRYRDLQGQRRDESEFEEAFQKKTTEKLPFGDM